MKDSIMNISKLVTNSYEYECTFLNLKPSLVPSSLLHMLDIETKTKMLKNRIDFPVTFRAEKNINRHAHAWFTKFLDLTGIKKFSGLVSINLDSNEYHTTASLMFSDREDYDKILSFLTMKKLAGEVR